MKYEVGQKVKIKSRDWYNRYTNGTEVDCGAYPFTSDMKEFCGQERIIANVCQECYVLLGIDDRFVWTDEMIEGLVEEETKPNIKEAKTYWDSIKDAWICPDGYIFKDENGNVINATKIVLEKKNKEYKALEILASRLAESVLMDWDKEEQVRLAKEVATKCHSIFNDKESREFVELVKKMREAEEELLGFANLDDEFEIDIRADKVDMLKREVDEYLKKMEI